MSISILSRATLVFLLFFLSACNNLSKDLPKENKKNDGITNEYNRCLEEINKGDVSGGLLKIYEIVSNNQSAEISEIGRDKLCELLYTHTKQWVETFSQVDFNKFKKYLDTGGLYPIDLPEGIASEKEYKKAVKLKLDKIRWSDREKELVNYIQGAMSQE